MALELTFQQQQVIDDFGQDAYTPSSNSNKARFALYAYIQSLIDGKPVCRRCTVKTNIDYNGVCPNCR